MKGDPMTFAKESKAAESVDVHEVACPQHIGRNVTFGEGFLIKRLDNSSVRSVNGHE